MLRITTRIDHPARDARPERSLTLCYADRCRSRLRVRLDDGGEAVLFLERGTVLRGGDVLLADDGRRVLVRSAAEPLFEVRAAADAGQAQFDLRRAAYHLGNRHIPVQLLADALRLDRDEVLRRMLVRLGMVVTPVVDAFEPESGAYGGGHRHDHDRDHQAGMIGEILSRQAHGEDPPDRPKVGIEPGT